MKYYYTYKTIDLKTGNYYIGKHSSNTPFDERYFGSGTRVKNILKVRPNDLLCGVISYHESDDALTIAEQSLLDLHVGKEKCLNISRKSRGGNLGVEEKRLAALRAPETREKISLSLVGNKRGIGNRKNTGNRLYAKNLSTGEVFGPMHCHEWIDMGFHRGHPINVAKGRRKSHKNHTFWFE